jgi:lipoprotein-anchoring transpeptidase ErfK/SrfK
LSLRLPCSRPECLDLELQNRFLTNSMRVDIIHDMKKILLVAVFLMILVMTAGPTPASAQTISTPQTEPYSGDNLCPPGAYMQASQDCLPLGPSVFLTQLAQKGITYPFRPLPISRRDPELNKVTYQYARINVEPPDRAPIFTTLNDAVDGSSPVQYLNPGRLLYVSYKDLADVNGKHYVYLQNNVWMRASPATYNDFQGLVFREAPTISPGWITDQTKARYAPGYNSPEVGDQLIHGMLVSIYSIQSADNTDWYMIGLNRWVERRFIRQLVINYTPPPGVDNNRWIEINLLEQTLAVMENGKILFATLIATGIKPYYTQPGLFKIKEKKPTETMSGAFEADQSDYYHLEDVPWTMYFDKLRAIHGAYWRAMYGFPQSHGCVNMSVGDARWVYDWAKEGDWVYVHDPSGETPTDPKAYSDGGA